MAGEEGRGRVDLMQWLSWPLKLTFFLVRGAVRVVSGNRHWPDTPETEGG